MFRKKIIKILTSTINEITDENKKLKYAIKEKDTKNVILFEHNTKLREKIKNLENNLEFITNNLSAQKRKQIGL